MAEIGYNGPMHKEEEGLGYGVFNAPEFKDLQKRVDALEEGGGAEQIQSDWNQTNSSAVDFIKNKPTIPEEYELPVASDAVLGGIKVGDNLTIDEDGTLNATGGSGGGGADWAAVEGEDGFIENKPFDVPTASNEDFEASSDVYIDATEMGGYNKALIVQGFMLQSIPSLNSVANISYGNKILQGSVRSKEMEIEGDTYTIKYIGNTDDVIFNEGSLLSANNNEFVMGLTFNDTPFPSISMVINDSNFDMEEMPSTEVTLSIVNITLSKLNASKLKLTDKFSVNANGELDVNTDKVLVHGITEGGLKLITNQSGDSIGVSISYNKSVKVYNIALYNYTNVSGSDAVFNSIIPGDAWDTGGLEDVERLEFTVLNEMISGYFRVDADDETSVNITVKKDAVFPGWEHNFDFPSIFVG